MNKLVAVAAVAAAVVTMCGCGKDTPTLRLYNWSDYIDPEIVEEFEQKYGCKVVVDTFDSNEEMEAGLKADATGYDIAVPSSYFIVRLREQKLIQEINLSRLVNLSNLDHGLDDVFFDPNCLYSVPYMISNAGIAYDKTRCPEFEPTWRMFNNAKYSRSCTLLDDNRETIGAALKALGYSLNTTNAAEITEAANLVIEWSKNVATFDNELYKSGIAEGRFIFVHGYNGDLGQVMEENEDIAYGLPKEGVSISCDEMVILAGAKQIDLAYKFIDFVHDPKVAARNMEYTRFRCPNAKAYAFLPDEVKNDEAIFIPEEIRAKSETIRDLGEANALYENAWDRIKAAQKAAQ